MGRVRAGCFGLGEFGADLHEDSAEPVAAVGAADAPEAVVPGVAFDEFGFAGVDEFHAQVFVRFKLESHEFCHDFDFDRFPVRSQLDSTAHGFCSRGRAALSDRESFGFVQRFARLKCMLDSRILNAVVSNQRRIEVRQKGILTAKRINTMNVGHENSPFWRVLMYVGFGWVRRGEASKGSLVVGGKMCATSIWNAPHPNEVCRTRCGWGGSGDRCRGCSVVVMLGRAYCSLSVDGDDGLFLSWDLSWETMWNDCGTGDGHR